LGTGRSAINRSSETSGRLGINLVFLYGGELASKLLALVVFGYLNRVLSKERFGDLEFAYGLVFVLALLADAGLALYGSREASREPGRLPALATQIAAIRVVILIGSLAIIGVTALLVEGDATSRWLVLLAGSTLLPIPLLLNWAFESRDEMHVVAGCSLLRQVVFVAGVVLCVDSGADLVLVPVLDAFGFLIATTVQQLLLRRRVGALWAARYLAGVGHTVRACLPLAVSAVVWALRLFFPLLALRFLAGSAETALFGIAHRLVIALHTFVWLYFINLLPSFSRLARSQDGAAFDHVSATSLRFVGWVVVTGGLAGGVLAPFIFRIYSPTYPQAAALFTIMVWMIAVAFLSGHHRYCLIAFRRQQDELKANFAGSLLSVAACLLAGSSLTPTVAAAIFVGAEGTTLIVAWFLCRISARPIAVMRPLAGPLVSGAVALGVVFTWAPSYPLLAGACVVLIQAAGLLLFDPRLVPEALILLRPRLEVQDAAG
jgi:O-antigen/teichoic acid export membrane protein